MAEPTGIEALAALIRAQVAGHEAWEAAELHLLGVGLLERLELLRIEPTPEMAAALMVVAHLLAERAPEWGGDARGTLADVAALGLWLLDGAVG